MKKIAFFDTKSYDKIYFNILNNEYQFKYYETKLDEDTAHLAEGCEGVIAFVNDNINKNTINILSELEVKIIAMRSAGYNNVDLKAAFNKIKVVRVPAYSPYAVAEHAMALLLSLNRKIHKAYSRTRDFNFSLDGLIGFDMYKKTVGVIGTGKIGRVFIDICRGFKMNILAYDPYPTITDVKYVALDELLSNSDIISIHCPLTDETKHLINSKNILKMKNNVLLINTSRGAIVDSQALLKALKEGRIKGAALDVYEEEADIFFEDFSNEIINDDVLTLLVSLPNVIVTSHQGFLTEEALNNIAEVTLHNLNQFFNEEPLDNEVCYKCDKN